MSSVDCRQGPWKRGLLCGICTLRCRHVVGQGGRVGHERVRPSGPGFVALSHRVRVGRGRVYVYVCVTEC